MWDGEGDGWCVVHMGVRVEEEEWTRVRRPRAYGYGQRTVVVEVDVDMDEEGSRYQPARRAPVQRRFQRLLWQSVSNRSGC